MNDTHFVLEMIRWFGFLCVIFLMALFLEDATWPPRDGPPGVPA